MKINRWKGLVSAASPYSLPGGAATLQNNLQIRKPGQLVPRPGLTALIRGSGEPLLALHRSSVGTSSADVLTGWYFEASPSAPEDAVQLPDQYYLKRLTKNSAGGFDTQTLFTTDVTPYSRPTFCEDRHGTMYVFFGNGIRPLAYRPTIDTAAVPFGLDAPTVAPSVTPAGDGWFIERVDVLASGTSYFTAPTITVTGGSPARNAVLRGVVQAGSLVAVDVVDGGSNFQAMPTFTISNEQLGIGFVGRGNLSTTSAVYGFTSTASPSVTGTHPAGTNWTSSYNLDTAAPTVAYTGPGGTTAFVPAAFDTQTGLFTAIVPLTPTAPAVGVGAFVRLIFNNTSAAFRAGDVDPVVPTGETVETTNFTTTTTGGSPVAVQGRLRSNLYTGQTAGNYYLNTFTPANSGIAGWYSQHYTANRDKFWAFSPRPLRYRFGKSQTYIFGIQPGDTFKSSRVIRQWADYYYPDYTQVSYYLLTGPETGFAEKANWTRFASDVQLDANNRPFIDIDLLPCKKADGSSFGTTPTTTNPSVRVYLAYCPESWLIANTLPTGDAEGRRFRPMNGQDRVSTLNGSPLTLHNGGQDEFTRWWAPGHCPDFQLSRPIVDIRQSSGSDIIGLTQDSIQVLGRGGLLEQGTKFALRFVQYNAADYRLKARSQDLTWLNSGVMPTSGRRFLQVTEAVWNAAMLDTWGERRTDFYFQANTVDTSTTALSLMRPGQVQEGGNGTPRVTITGQGWAASGQQASVQVRYRQISGEVSGAGVAFTVGRTFTFTTETLIAATTAKRIGSVDILSGGQNYFREPTILSSGGGGYGLRLGSTVANGQVTSVVVLEGGDGFTSDTQLTTDVQPAKLMPVLRGTMRGTYRCAYRFADYRPTEVLRTTFTTRSPLDGSRVIQLTDVTGVKPGMVLTGNPALRHMTRIVSLQDNNATLSLDPLSVVTVASACVIRDMERPAAYSDFSPIVDVDASTSGSGRASTLQWSLTGVNAPGRADHVEFYRTSADQSLVFYRLEMFGSVNEGVITFSSPSGGPVDGLSDEELFDPDRLNYAALPVVLPNGNVNAFRFGIARSDMAVAVAWQDRLWFAVSTSGADANTVYFSEFDEFESCPDVNDLPIQVNLRTTDYLTALIPFGSVLMAMQNSHAYTITFNTDPSVDAAVTLAAHRGALAQQCWDFFDETLYIADERGVYSMDKSGNVKSLSEPVRDFFDEGRLDLSQRANFFLKVDHSTGILRLFAVATGSGAEYPHFALCLHINNETWWTESWPTALISATDYRETGQQDRPVYGSADGSALRMVGLTDAAQSDLFSVAITNPGSGYVDPPTVTAPGQGAAQFQAIVRNGQVAEILLVYGGWGYGETSEDQANPGQLLFDATVTLTISAPPAGGVQATATAQARQPNVDLQDATSAVSKATVPWAIRTGPLELMNDTNTRKGDAEFSRSVTVTYRPTPGTVVLNLREYYNNSNFPRANVMRRDRGTGFVHDTDGAKTTLDMSATRTSLGMSTGLATAQFAGRSLGDMASADRHLAIDLSCDSKSADDPAVAASEPLIYALEINGVVDGGE